MKNLLAMVDFKHYFKWLGLLQLCLLLWLAKAQAGDLKSLNQLNLDYRVNQRIPNHFVPNQEMIDAPIEKKHWSKDLFAEDNKGVMSSMREQVTQWREDEDYVHSWSLEERGIDYAYEQKQKEKYLLKKSLRYVDKRISGEIKHAEKGSTWESVGSAQKALRPSTEVGFSQYVKLKFKARVLQGKAYVFLVNPIVETEAEFKASGGKYFRMKRKFASIGVTSLIDYSINEKEYTASIRKPLTKTISATIDSKQSDSHIMFSEQADKIIRFNYSKPF